MQSACLFIMFTQTILDVTASTAVAGMLRVAEDFGCGFKSRPSIPECLPGPYLTREKGCKRTPNRPRRNQTLDRFCSGCSLGILYKSHKGHKMSHFRDMLTFTFVVDASTKIPSGILTGHFADYGNYDECLQIENPFATQHCLATILPPPDLAEDIIKNVTSLMPTIALRWSYCIPASCPPIVLQTTLEELLNDLKVNVSVRQSDCNSRNRKSITTEEYIGISIWGIFLGLALSSTIYDVIVEKSATKRNPWLCSFSIYTNGKKLIKANLSTETMAPLNGIRFLSICWVVLGHRYFFTSSSSLLNLTDFAKEMEKIQSQFFIQGVLAVDTFFLLSGLLNSYHLLKVLEKTNGFPAKMYYLHRYIRLTPVLAAIVLMYATWYTLIGDGPVWDQTTSVWKQLCVDNWWSTLLYINNYYNPISQCAGQSWYLAVDTQLYWLAPLVILPLWKSPRMGKALLWVMLFLSTVAQFAIAYVYKFRMSFTFGLDLEELQKVTKMIYTPTHTRASPYIIGIMLGHFLHNKKKTNTRIVLSRIVVCTGWLLSTIVALCVILGNYQFSRPLKDHPYDPWESSVYIAFHRLAWGAAIGWIIISCLSKNGGIANLILSWNGFVPLSRLTYCIFLCHMAIQQYNVGTARTPDYFQHFNQVHRYFGDLLFSVFAAAGLSLVFESPILVLEKLLGRKPPGKTLEGEVNGGFQEDSTATNKTHEI